MTPAAWTYADIAGDLRTDHEEHVMMLMLDEHGDPKPRFRNWTPAQALSHVRNIAEARRRAVAHETGATA